MRILQSSIEILSRKMRRCSLVMVRASLRMMRRMSWMIWLACWLSLIDLHSGRKTCRIRTSAHLVGILHSDAERLKESELLCLARDVEHDVLAVTCSSRVITHAHIPGRHK